MTGELIIGCETFPQFARCFYDEVGQFSVELVNLRLKDSVLGFLNSSERKFWRKKFLLEKIFHELVFNRENFPLYGIMPLGITVLHANDASHAVHLPHLCLHAL